MRSIRDWVTAHALHRFSTSPSFSEQLWSCAGSPQVSAGVLLRVADSGFRAVSVAQPVSEMATDVVLVDRIEEDAPYVAVSDLSALRQQWPDLVISSMTNHQLELEELCRRCKKEVLCSPVGVVYIL